VLFAIACNRESEVQRTVPPNRETGLSSRAVIAVRLDDTMTDEDDHNTDARNIVVTGDQNEEPYSGTIERTRHARVFNGQTVEEFRQFIRSQGGEPVPPVMGEGSAERGDDTLVFLLQDGEEFGPGEVIRVFVRQDITVRGLPLKDDIVFSFTVEGGAARAEGNFFITSTAPGQTDAGVAVDPSVRASFSVAVNSATLGDAITLRGLQSGVHVDGTNLLSPSATNVREVTRRLAATDSFLPGEWVEATWSSRIQSIPSGSPPTPANLSPYLLRFQVRPGLVNGGWSRALGSLATPQASVILSADFVPEAEGAPAKEAEFVVGRADPASLTLLDRTSGAAFRRSDLDLGASFRLAGAVVVDSDEDGAPEIVTVLERKTPGENEAGARLQHVVVNAAGALEPDGTPTEVPRMGIQAVLLADLNAEGLPELAIAHQDAKFRPMAQAPEEDSGHLTIFELSLGLPPGGIDPGDPSNLLQLNFSRRDRPIRDFELAGRLEAHDLDGDGRIDLVAQADDGRVLLYRNQSSHEDPFGFRRIGPLSGRGGTNFAPQNWVAVDADGDRDIDIVSWEQDTALLHENHQDQNPPLESGAEETSTEEEPPKGLLFENVTPLPFNSAGVNPRRGDVVVAANIDGDGSGRLDLAVASASSGLTLLLRQPGALIFNARSLAAGGVSAAIALADVNGDTGLDVVGASGGVAAVFLADGVVPVPLPQPSSFRLVAGAVERVDGADVVSVTVRGDITRSFAGYSLALDYDEALLSYQGFVAPEAFDRRASFTLCPNAQGLGCSGRATARMTYLQGTIGAPSADLELGTFRFRLSQVTQTAETMVEFTSFQAGNDTFANQVLVSQGGVQQNLPVERLGEPVRLTLNPPPPPELALQCSVEERLAASFRVRVSWSSPAGTRFETARIVFAGETVHMRAWSDGAVVLEDAHAGRVAIELVALAAGDDPSAPPPTAPRATCEVVSVFQPAVQCPQNGTSVVVSWTLSHAVDLFNVYRNGVRFRQVPGTAEEFAVEDPTPSPVGGDSYEVAGVIGTVEGPRGRCTGPDPMRCTTEPPIRISGLLDRRVQPSAPNVLRFRWRNGEAYDRLFVFLTFVPRGEGAVPEEVFPGGEEIEASRTEFVYDGDRDRGGARPGSYTFTLQARNRRLECAGQAGEVASVPVAFPVVDVPLPPLSEVQLACTRQGISDIAVTWQEPWKGYDRFLSLELRQIVSGTLVRSEVLSDRLLLSDREFLVSSVEPIGSYEFTLRATFDASTLETTCSAVAFSPSLSFASTVIDVPLGIESFNISVRARGVFSVVTGYSFEIDYPETITLLDFPDPPATAGRKRLRIEDLEEFEDPDDDGDFVTNGNVTLRTLRARVSNPADPGIAGSPPQPLLLEVTQLRFAGSSELRAVPNQDAELHFRSRFVQVDRAQLSAGSGESARIAVRGTFVAPPGHPEYRFVAFTIHLRFDTDELELLPVTPADQSETAVGGEGVYFLPPAETLAAVNRSGDLIIGWIGFNLSDPTQQDYLEPVTDAEILVLRFRSRVPASSPGLFSSIRFVSEARENQPTAFFPEQDVPGFPDVEAFLNGGVSIVSQGVALTASFVRPARGPLTGGNRVTLLGQGFPVPGERKPELRLLPPQGEPLTVDQNLITLLDARRLEFAVPDSGLRSLRMDQTAPYEIELTAAEATARLSGAYRFDAPRVLGTDVTSVRSSGGDLVRITGAGLSAFTRAHFVVDDVSIPADVFRPEADGSALVIETRAMPGPDPGQDFRSAMLVVTVADPIPTAPPLAVITLPQTFRILPSPADAELAITAVEPSQGSVCGGEDIVVRGRGFLPNVEVLFGDTIAAFVYLSSSALRVTVPAAAAPGQTVLRLRQDAQSANADFEFVPPPAFVRGDANGDSRVDVSDATLISSIVLQGSVSFPRNRDALDTNDDGRIDFGDALNLLRYLFEAGAMLPAPFPAAGQDPSADGICQ
jgi:hypothetical protein